MQCFKSIFKGHFQTEFEVFLFNGLKIQTFLETLEKSRFFFRPTAFRIFLKSFHIKEFFIQFGIFTQNS